MSSAPRNLNPKITSFSITIQLPISRSINYFVTKDIRKHKQNFIDLENRCEDLEEKKLFDNCRNTLNLAIKHGASLYSISNIRDINQRQVFVQFIFSFTQLSTLIAFNQDYLNNQF